jgi:hypothetical protein
MFNLIGLKVKQIADELKRIQVIDKITNEYHDDNYIKRKPTNRNSYLEDEFAQNDLLANLDLKDFNSNYIDLDIETAPTTFSTLVNKFWYNVHIVKDKFMYLDFLENPDSLIKDDDNVKFAANNNGSEVYVIYNGKYLLICNAYRRSYIY